MITEYFFPQYYTSMYGNIINIKCTYICILALFSIALQKRHKMVRSHVLYKSLHSSTLFQHFVIVVYESLSCPQGEKMDLKIINPLLIRRSNVQMLENQGGMQDLVDFSEEL